MAKKSKAVRIVSLADFHCGNITGITPDQFNPKDDSSYKLYVYRRALYEWVCREIDKLRPFDICVANGDLIDGKGPKTGGNEQITTSRPKQIAMAVEFLKFVDAKEYHFTFGTGYHVGPEDDWEIQIAQEFNAVPEDVVTLDVNGLIMKWRHHINGSLTPSGRATPLLRQQEWDALWSLDGEFQRADVMVFSHVHYFQSFTNRFGTAFTQAGLQGLGGSQLGARRMGGIVDYGFLHFDVGPGKAWSWADHRLIQKPSVRGGLLPK